MEISTFRTMKSNGKGEACGRFVDKSIGLVVAHLVNWFLGWASATLVV